MDWLYKVDWHTVFVPSTSLAEVVVRGTLMYLALFVFLRVLRRETGAIGITDLLVVVIIADAAQNALAGEYKSITEGVLLILVIGFWDYLLDYLGFRFRFFERLLRPAALPLIDDGQPIRRNLRREMITNDELLSLLREQGVETIAEVKHAYLEGDGRVSVIKKKRGGGDDDDAGGGDDTESPIPGMG